MFGNLRNRARKSETSNPLLRSALSEKNSAAPDVTAEEYGRSLEMVEPMTVSGAVNKTFLLTVLMVVVGAYAFTVPSSLLMWGGAIGGLIMVLIGSFKPKQAVWASPAYAVFEGLFLGSVSAIFAYQYDGIILQAASLTVAILLAMLILYQTGTIKVTQKFRSGIFMATGGILLVYLLSWGLSMLGINMPFLHEGGVVGIVISCVILAIASLNLLIDFDNFEKGEQLGLPKYYEWVFSMGLMVTLVWIYVELLRLLSMVMGDD